MTRDTKIHELLSYGSGLGRYDAELDTIVAGRKPSLLPRLVDNSTYVGMEIEIERVLKTSGILNLGLDTPLWRNVEDGSLRNNGKEFVSLPIKGEHIKLALDVFNHTMDKEKLCIGHEFTDRTSVHVHMNVRDMSVEHLSNMLMVYILVEPLLYSWTSIERGKGVFCVPISQSKDMQEDLGNFLSKVSKGDFRNTFEPLTSWQKYTGLNLLPIFNFGTIEFRHLYGTKDPEILITWLNIIFSMKRFACANKFESLKERICNINTTSEYSFIIREIFGELSHLLLIPEIDKTLEETSILLKNIFTYSENRIGKTITPIARKLSQDISGNKFIALCTKTGWLKGTSKAEQIRECLSRISLYERDLGAWNKNIANLDNLLTNSTKIEAATLKQYKRDFTNSTKERLKLLSLIATEKNKIEVLEGKQKPPRVDLEDLEIPVTIPRATTTTNRVFNEWTTVRANAGWETVPIPPPPPPLDNDF